MRQHSGWVKGLQWIPINTYEHCYFSQRQPNNKRHTQQLVWPSHTLLLPLKWAKKRKEQSKHSIPLNRPHSRKRLNLPCLSCSPVDYTRKKQTDKCKLSIHNRRKHKHAALDKIRDDYFITHRQQPTFLNRPWRACLTSHCIRSCDRSSCDLCVYHSCRSLSRDAASCEFFGIVLVISLYRLNCFI